MLNLLEKLEERLKKPYDQWNYLEREQYQKWQQQLQNNQKEVSVPDIKTHIQTMLMALVKANANETNSRETDLFQKARIRNYLELLDFLDGPERARKAVEAQIEKISQGR